MENEAVAPQPHSPFSFLQTDNFTQATKRLTFVTVKKFGGIAIVCVYFLLTLGMQLHLHYCCGELADLHLFSSEHCGHSEQQDEDHCCKKSNCCSFIHLDLKVDDSHQPSENFRLLPIDVEQPIACYSTSESSVISRPGFTSVSHSPPPISKRYVLYQALVLYA